MKPAVFDIGTPKLSDSVTGENCMTSLGVCNHNCDVSCNIEEILNCTDISSDQDVTKVLNEIRIKNLNRVIIGHLNVNFFVAKIDATRSIMTGNVDIMVFSETKLDDSYPMAQLFIEGFGKPLRLDRNANGGGLLIYVRADIPCKQLEKHDFPDNIEGIFVEINFRKSKWLMLGTYHPPSQNDGFYFEKLACALDIYTQTYHKILLTGDFNAEEDEEILSEFMELYDLKNLVKEKTCLSLVKTLGVLIFFSLTVADLFKIQWSYQLVLK